MDPIAIAMALLLLSVVAGRLINERGLRTLTPDQKGVLVDGFAAHRKYSLLPLLAILVLSFAAPRAFPLWTMMSALMVYVVAVSVVAIRKMRALGLPASYIRTYGTSQAVQFGGFLFCLAALQVWAP